MVEEVIQISGGEKMKASDNGRNSADKNQFSSCVSILSLYQDEEDLEENRDYYSSTKRKACQARKFIYRYLEHKVLEIGRHVRVKRGKTALKGLLRFVPGVKKSSKAKGYDHLITDEERR